MLIIINPLVKWSDRLRTQSVDGGRIPGARPDPESPLKADVFRLHGPEAVAARVSDTINSRAVRVPQQSDAPEVVEKPPRERPRA